MDGIAHPVVTNYINNAHHVHSLCTIFYNLSFLSIWLSVFIPTSNRRLSIWAMYACVNSRRECDTKRGLAECSIINSILYEATFWGHPFMFEIVNRLFISKILNNEADLKYFSSIQFIYISIYKKYHQSFAFVWKTHIHDAYHMYNACVYWYIFLKKVGMHSI